MVKVKNDIVFAEGPTALHWPLGGPTTLRKFISEVHWQLYHKIYSGICTMIQLSKRRRAIVMSFFLLKKMERNMTIF